MSGDSAKTKWWFAWALLLVALESCGLGCGINWAVPSTHFADVDEKGHVCVSEKVGEVDFGEDLKLPLIVNFRSDREAVSPYVGKGWVLALLESRVVQTTENSFELLQPDGWVRPLLRRADNRSILDGGPAWKAEIKENTIVVSVECGWRFIYKKGKIALIGTPKNRQLEFIYGEGGVTEIRENGVARLTVGKDSAGNATVTANNQTFAIQLADRPRIESLNGANVVAGIDNSLKSLNSPDRPPANSYVFSVDQSVQPTVTIADAAASKKVLTWDPKTKRIVSDGVWQYRITAPEVAWENAIVERVDKEGNREKWEKNLGKGFEAETSVDGTTTTSYWFETGLLAGRLRKIEETRKGETKLNYQVAYDEMGHKLRELLPDGTIVTYGADGVERKRPDGEVTLIRKNGSNQTQITTAGPGANGISLIVDATGKIHRVLTTAKTNARTGE